MLHTYTTTDNQSFIWGFGATCGFFVQLFDDGKDEENDTLLVDADQTQPLTGYCLVDETITYESMKRILAEHHADAHEDFVTMMNQPLPQPLIGYPFTNEDKQCEKKVPIRTYQDLFLFIDSLTHGYLITDASDGFTDLHRIYQSIRNKVF